MRKQISNRFNEILLKREKRELRYKLAKLSFLTERKKEIEQETNIVMKILKQKIKEVNFAQELVQQVLIIKVEY